MEEENSYHPKINVGIFGQNKQSFKQLRKLLNDIPTTGTFYYANSICSAIPLILKHIPDVVFIDTELNIQKGFDLAEEIQRLNLDTPIVLLAKDEKYALKALKLKVFDYLIAPYKADEVNTIINFFLSQKIKKTSSANAEQTNQSRSVSRLRFCTRNGFILVETSQLMYILADGNYSKLCMLQDKIETISLNIGSVFKMLPDNEFFRINRSVIVNIQYLTRVDRKNSICILEDYNQTHTFHISRTRIKELEDHLSNSPDED